MSTPKYTPKRWLTKPYRNEIEMPPGAVYGTAIYDESLDGPTVALVRHEDAVPLIQAAPDILRTALAVCRLNVDRGVAFGGGPGTDETFQDALLDLYDACQRAQGFLTTEELLSP